MRGAKRRLLLAGMLALGAVASGVAASQQGVAPPAGTAPWPSGREQVGVDAFEGTFDNAAQVARLPPEVARRPTPGTPWVDHQHARFVRFPAPVLGELVYYLEWRSGGPDGPVSRQRIWAFDGVRAGRPVMRFYTLQQPGLWVAAASDPALLAQLSRSGLLNYPEGCELPFRRDAKGRLEGEIPPGACVIVARGSERRMRIEARITLDRDSLLYDEAGLLEDGRAAFRVPEGFRYEFERLR